jgi:protein-S-isoprenylcysteine O-methyltransferase Ste14
MYASMWLWGMAQTLLLQNWIAGWAGLVLFLPMYVLRVPREEQMMVEQFGETYREYINRTGRVVPRLGG